METHLVETRFGLVEVRLYRLHEGWWPVLVRGGQLLPSAPVLRGPMAGSVREAVAQMVVAIERLEGPVAPGSGARPHAGVRRASSAP
jgi:hypothetical protein